MSFKDLSRRQNKLITYKEHQIRDHRSETLDKYLKQYEYQSASADKANESITIEMNQNHYKRTYQDMTHLNKSISLSQQFLVIAPKYKHKIKDKDNSRVH